MTGALKFTGSLFMILFLLGLGVLFAVFFHEEGQAPITKKDADDLIGKLREARKIEIEIIDPVEFSRRRVKWITAYTSSDSAEIAKLAEAIVINPKMPQLYSGFLGGPIVRFTNRSGQEDKIVFHAGKSISSPKLPNNLWLIDTDRLDAWFVARGMPPITRERGGWLSRAPSSIRSQLISATARYNSSLNSSLELEFPEPVERSTVLLNWYGSGSLSWDDANEFERIAFKLLCSTEPHDIVSAINTMSDNPMRSNVLVGFLRFIWQLPEDTQREIIGQFDSKVVAELVDTAKEHSLFFASDRCMQLLEERLFAGSKPRN